MKAYVSYKNKQSQCIFFLQSFPYILAEFNKKMLVCYFIKIFPFVFFFTELNRTKFHAFIETKRNV